MSAPVPLAIYDFDGTMIPGDSIVAYLRFAFARGYLKLPALLGAAFSGLASRMGLMDAGEAKRRALRFRSALAPEAGAELDSAFAETLLTRLRPDALTRMARDQAAGRRIVLLSASTDHYMQPLARRLGVDTLICTRLSELPGGNCRGEAKLSRLEAWLHDTGLTPDYPGSAAYGDSASDAQVLALTGHPTLVNPSRRARRKLKDRFPIENWPDRRDA